MQNTKWPQFEGVTQATESVTLLDKHESSHRSPQLNYTTEAVPKTSLRCNRLFLNGFYVGGGLHDTWELGGVGEQATDIGAAGCTFKYDCNNGVVVIRGAKHAVLNSDSTREIQHYGFLAEHNHHRDPEHPRSRLEYLRHNLVP